MSTQLSLPAAPHNGTPTSMAAALTVNVGKQEQTILTLLDRWPGLTQDQISEITGLLRSAVAGRVNRLERLGLVYKDGTRRSRYGKACAVYHRTALS